MKKVNLLLAMLILLTFTALANHGHNYWKNSELEIKLWDNSSFHVVFDNYTFAKSNRFGLDNIKPGVHQIQVLKLKPNKYGHGGLKQVLYSGAIKIPKNAKMKAIVTPSRNLDIQIVRANNHYEHQADCGFSNGYNCSCHSYNDWNSNSCDDNWGFENNIQNYGPSAMNNIDFNNLYNMVENTSFDDSKLSIVKQALSYNYMNTEQVSLLLGLFSFESYKLKLAKHAYTKVIDPQNYYLVNNQFTFNSSINELNNYIIQYG